MASPTHVRTEQRGSTRVVFLARPETRNALSAELVSELMAAIAEAERDPSTRAVVVAADGPVFAAGGDLAQIRAAMTRADGAEEVLAIGAALRSLEQSPLPILAALTGDALGGGAELVLLFDYVVADRSAAIEYRHTRMGLSPAWGSAGRLLARVGPVRASRLLLWGQRLAAAEAAALGLVGEVTDDGQALVRAVELADELAQADREVLARNKRGLVLAQRVTLASQAEIEADEFRALFAGPAHQAAVAQFFQKKPR